MMMQRQTQSTEQPQASDQQRVTPEELAKALAAVEARKEHAAHEVAGTIPIGEAVRQLGFDATSDEIWQEVQAQRQRQTLQAATRLPRKARAGLWIGICFGFMVLVGLVNTMRSSDDSPASEMPAVNTSVPFIAPSTPQTVIKTLAEVANGQTFFL